MTNNSPLAPYGFLTSKSFEVAAVTSRFSKFQVAVLVCSPLRHARFQADAMLHSLESNAAPMFFALPAVYSRLLILAEAAENFRKTRYHLSVADPVTAAKER